MKKSGEAVKKVDNAACTCLVNAKGCGCGLYSPPTLREGARGEEEYAVMEQDLAHVVGMARVAVSRCAKNAEAR